MPATLAAEYQNTVDDDCDRHTFRVLKIKQFAKRLTGYSGKGGSIS